MLSNKLYWKVLNRFKHSIGIFFAFTVDPHGMFQVLLVITIVLTPLHCCYAFERSIIQNRLQHRSTGAKSFASSTKTRQLLQRHQIASKRATPTCTVASNWTVRSQEFCKNMSGLGVFDVPGVKIKQVSQELVDSLKAVKDHILVVKNVTNSTSKRENNHFCEETKVEKLILALFEERLVYEIDSIECLGQCYLQAFGVSIGTCELTEKEMVVYIQTDTNNFVPKVVKVGCACECKLYANFQ